MSNSITPPFYPIVYVRGFSPTQGAREAAFSDAFYGFADSSVTRREIAPDSGAPNTPRFAVDIFEGQLVRFIKEQGYIDALNDGLEGLRAGDDPTRSLWICRFYDRDVLEGRARLIEDHAGELLDMITRIIPQALQKQGVKVVDENGKVAPDFKVILLAHSMGGLVCRTLIQNLFPQNNLRASDWIHRLVTMGTPHGGIDFGNIPDVLEHLVGNALNPLGGAMFQPRQMRTYLKLPTKTPLHSLNKTFPPERCLCIVGSDYRSYREDAAGKGTQTLTGNRSDGLVKQDNAWIEGAFTANVHRAHSGTQGIVNSPESYANIQRFLFGDVRVAISMTDLKVLTQGKSVDFFDVDMRVAIRNTGVYLHQRNQNPCENGWVFKRDAVPTSLPLYTGFLNTKLRPRRAGPTSRFKDPFSHFMLTFRVVEHQPPTLLDWDREYPERAICTESLELRLTVDPHVEVQSRWLSKSLNKPSDWEVRQPEADGSYIVPLKSDSFEANIRFEPGAWPYSY